MIVEIQSSQSDHNVATLTIEGEIDMNSCRQVQAHLLDLYKVKPRAIVVDLSKVSYIDSFGIATLVEGLQWGHNNKTKFRLASMAPAVKDVFNIANLTNVFEVFDSTEEAVKDF